MSFVDKLHKVAVSGIALFGAFSFGNVVWQVGDLSRNMSKLDTRVELLQETGIISTDIETAKEQFASLTEAEKEEYLTKDINTLKPL